jgi:basic amino acid/polyamine antiporter, APA family
VSLGIALLIYLPLLLVISTVGMGRGESVTDAARRDPQTIVALAAQNYFGPIGYWMVIVAAILSMLSALEANIFAASRVSLAMSRDRTLPTFLSQMSARRKTPAAAVLVTALLVAIIVLALPDVAAAGAASSLIFLITFALAHWIAILVRQRSTHNPPPFRTPFYPLVPVFGGLSCAALAVYQGIAVPSAGLIAALWLTAGGLLFLGVFAHRARVADASTEATDSELLRLRGRNPLVLVPISNPNNARGLVAVANALAPPLFGRVLLLSVVVAPRGWRPGDHPGPLQNSQSVIGEAIAASVESGLFPESLTTVATDAWSEIARVAKFHRCDSLLLGLTHLDEQNIANHLEELLGAVDCDIAVLRAPRGWNLEQTRRILVPSAGRGGHDRLLARLLSSFERSIHRQVTFVRVLPDQTSAKQLQRAESELRSMAQGLGCADPLVAVVAGDSPVDEIASRAAASDLLILGVRRVSRREKLFGQFALQVAKQTDCPILLISRAG